MRFAREQGILCQGRGSAANSLVAYLLGITPIDPLAHDLVFERFLSDERRIAPDIDIDFQADRREEVIQYIYQKYGMTMRRWLAPSSPTARAARFGMWAKRWDCRSRDRVPLADDPERAGRSNATIRSIASLII